MKRRILEVGELPTIGFGHRDPLFWGVGLLVAIEGTMLVLLALAYYYVRERTSPWPPDLMSRDLAWVATAELVLLLVSIPPMRAASAAAVRGSVKGMRRGLLFCTLIGLLAAACRFWIFANLPFRWDENAYTSVVWTLLGFQTLHLATGLGENALFVTLLHRGPVEEKHRVDVNVTSPLWYFVVAGALLTWSVVFLEVLLTEVS